MPFELNSKLITSDVWCLSRREWGPAIASRGVSFPSWQRPLLHPQAQLPLFGSEETFLKPSNWMGPGSTETRTQEPCWPHLPASQLTLLTSPVLSLLYVKGSAPPRQGGGPPPTRRLRHIACKTEKMQSPESSLLRAMRPLCFVQLIHIFPYRLNLRIFCFIPGTLFICSAVETGFQGTWSFQKVGSAFF